MASSVSFEPTPPYRAPLPKGDLLSAELSIYDEFWPDQMALYETLRDAVEWEGSMAARRTASFGVPYNYSQMTYPAVPMHPALVPVQEKLKEVLGVVFNNCLLNFYQGDRSKLPRARGAQCLRLHEA